MSAEPVNHVIDGAPAIVSSAREQWLMRRRELVTAADVAAILGEDPYRKPGDVYAEKLGLCEEAESWPMFYGSALQGAVGAAYTRKTGRPVRMASLEVPEITIHPDLAWLGATLDGTTEGSDLSPSPTAGPGVFEAKVSSVAHTWDEHELPTHFQLQVTTQCACARLPWGGLAALVSTRSAPRTQDVLFDRELFDLMVPKLEAFHDCVRRKEPPVDDVDWWSTEAIRRVWSKNNGETKVLDEETARVVTRWRGLKAARERIEDTEERFGNRIRLALEGAALGLLPAGFGGGGVALSNVGEGWVAAHKRAGHARLLDKQPKGGK